MRRGVDSARQSADHRQTGVSELVGEFLRRFRSVMCRAARTDDADGVLIALGQFAPNIKHDRRRMNLAQLTRIQRRLLRNHLRAEFANAFQFRGKIDELLPVYDLFGNFVADSFDLAQIAPRAPRIRSRCFENFEQLAQPHRPHRRQHVERDAGFGGVHDCDRRWRRSFACNGSTRMIG